MRTEILHTVIYTLSGPDAAHEHTVRIRRNRLLTHRGLERIIRREITCSEGLAPTVVRVDVSGV